MKFWWYLQVQTMNGVSLDRNTCLGRSSGYFVIPIHSSGYFSRNSLYASATVLSKIEILYLCNSWLNNDLSKVFAGLLLVQEQVSSNNFRTNCDRSLGEFGSDASALRMALVRVLVVLFAGDVIVLPSFFRSWYRFCRALSFCLLSNRDFLTFSVCDVSTLSLYWFSPIRPFNFARYFFCLFFLTFSEWPS